MKAGSLVSIVHSDNLAGSPTDLNATSLNSVNEIVKKAMFKSCDFKKLVRDKTVLIKPNLVRSTPQKIYATTDLRVIHSVAQLTLEAGASKVIIGEKPGWGRPAKPVFKELGVDRIPKMLDVQTCYFDEDQLVEIDVPKARVFSKIFVPKTVMDCEVLINVPKVKTHMQTIVSLGIKNLHGIVPDNQRRCNHRNDLGYKLVDILRVIKPTLTVSDCIWPMEGQGPLNGRNIKNFNVVLACTDVVAVDAVTCSIMGIDPFEVDAIRIAHMEGLGCGDLMNIKTVGTKPTQVKRYFKRACLSSAGVYANVLCMESGACQGCLSSIRHSLDRLFFERKLQCLKRKVFLYSGKHFETPEHVSKDDKPYFVGDCALEVLKRSNPALIKNVNIVRGCPPHIYDLYYNFCENEHHIIG